MEKSSLMNIEFDIDCEPVYGVNNKYIETKTNSYLGKINKFSSQKNTKRECVIQVFVTDVRFCN